MNSLFFGGVVFTVRPTNTRVRPRPHRPARFRRRRNAIEVTLELSVHTNTQNKLNECDLQVKTLPVQFPFRFGGINVAGDRIRHASRRWSPAEGFNCSVAF